MFEGSRQVAPGDHFRIVVSSGGTLNGTTNTERTNYFECVPAEQLGLALWLEADRMGGLLDAVSQESLDKQRDVVRNERRQRYDNVPYGTAIERLCELVYPVGHPYHHQPIGSMEDLEAASLEDVHQFFRDYYAPNNAVLTVAGDFEPSAALEMIEFFFGVIPPNHDLARIDSPPSLPPLTEELRSVFVENVPNPAVYLGYRLPAEGDPQLDHLQVAVTLLTSGRASVLNRKIVRNELAQQANGFIDRRVGGTSVGVFSVTGRPGVPIQKAEQALLDEFLRLADVGPTDGELERAKALIERGWLDRLSDVESRADDLSRCVTLRGDAALIDNQLDVILATTAEDVRAAVGRYLSAAQPAVVAFDPIPTKEVAA